MELSDFAIGETFWTHVGAFRCTDIGTRVVVAVKLGPRGLEGRKRGWRAADHEADRGRPELAEWTAVRRREVVFDENELLGCFRSEAEL